jgi:hypothetical protein
MSFNLERVPLWKIKCILIETRSNLSSLSHKLQPMQTTIFVHIYQKNRQYPLFILAANSYKAFMRYGTRDAPDNPAFFISGTQPDTDLHCQISG